jgi:hypothetical protein
MSFRISDLPRLRDRPSSHSPFTFRLSSFYPAAAGFPPARRLGKLTGVSNQRFTLPAADLCRCSRCIRKVEAVTRARRWQCRCDSNRPAAARPHMR